MQAPLPRVIAWNLTTRCDLACPHCYLSAGGARETHDELPEAMFRRLTDEILAVSPSPLFVLTGGEPLVRADLEDLAAYAAARGATVVVGTNGTGLTRERIARLAAAGVTGVAVSIDSLDAAVHDRLRGRVGALAKTLAGIERLRESPLQFLVQTTVGTDNRHELSSIAAWAHEAGAFALNVYQLVQTGRARDVRALAPEVAEQVDREIASLEQTWRGRLMVRSKCQPHFVRHVWALDADAPVLADGARCPAGQSYARITPTGLLTPCPYLPLVAADLGFTTFGEAWSSSPVLRSLRGEPGGKCGRCEFRVLCGGCRARAWPATGDLMAEDPSCSHIPTGRPLRAIPDGPLRWTEPARRSVQRIPGFIRPVVEARIEAAARSRGQAEVTTDLIDELRQRLPAGLRPRHPHRG